MDFEKWWFNNELNLDFYNFEKEEAEKVWNAALDEAVKAVDTRGKSDFPDGLIEQVIITIKALKDGGL